MSKLDANAVLILGHRTSALGGESVQVEKFSHLLSHRIEEVLDLFSLFEEAYADLAELNYALAEQGEAPLTDLPYAKPFLEKIAQHRAQTLLLLSWNASLAALIATGIQKRRRLISKFHVHHPQERVFPRLYEEAQLLITESLLANVRGAAYGIPKSKLLYFPHHYVDIPLPPKRATPEVVIGVVSRFERGKNCEYALEVVRRLVEKGERIRLILMGDFAVHTTDPTYQENFQQMLDAYSEAPWFSWEKKRLPYPDVLRAYNRFDLCLQLSGAEAGSNVIVELLGMGKAVVALNASTNPFLFKGGAYLVEAREEICPGQLSFKIPQIDALEGAVEALVRDRKLRSEWGKRAEVLAKRRFHKSVAERRLPLLFSATDAQLQTVWDEDRKEYGL